MEAQKLDRHDIEGVYELHMKLSGKQTHTKDSGGTTDDHSAQLPADSEPSNNAALAYKQAITALLELPRDEALQILRDYVVAAAAKDCSVMVTMRALRERESGQDCVEFWGRQWQFRIGVVDVDFKPLSKLQAHFDLDRQILSAYLKLKGM